MQRTEVKYHDKRGTREHLGGDKPTGETNQGDYRSVSALTMATCSDKGWRTPYSKHMHNISILIQRTTFKAFLI